MDVEEREYTLPTGFESQKSWFGVPSLSKITRVSAKPRSFDLDWPRTARLLFSFRDRWRRCAGLAPQRRVVQRKRYYPDQYVFRWRCTHVSAGLRQRAMTNVGRRVIGIRFPEMRLAWDMDRPRSLWIVTTAVSSSEK